MTEVPVKSDADIKTPQQLVTQPELWVVLGLDSDKLPSTRFPPEYFGYYLNRDEAEAGADEAVREHPDKCFVVMKAVARWTALTSSQRVEY